VRHDPELDRSSHGTIAPNIDERTVEGFGREWSAFDQTSVAEGELDDIFQAYFAIFPWEALTSDAVGFDAGCGSGRWAARVAPRVRKLHCIDASWRALAVAQESLADQTNCRFHHASVDELSLPSASMDFGYALGVLHHVPDPLAGLRSCVRLLKPGAPFLIYLYYALDNRPTWFRALWRASDLARRGLCLAPHRVRLATSTLLALTIYWPLARLSARLERAGADIQRIPLAQYRTRSLYTMRTDAYDRFSTPLEHRFTREQVIELMAAAGLTDITLSPSPPYWCAVGWTHAK
jgi:SAM-dependent methyltransferase